ncbi:MAG: hypothetical protein U5L05_17945 [Rubrivivax sp.]|nr:hypothetical protein [Rubrivivax sp.]
MRTNHSMRRLGVMGRFVGTAALAAAALSTACANPFDTNVDNPNAVIETALNDPAGATTLVNGQGASVTRALTSIYGPYHVATDELTWVGSREFWKNLDDGDLSDPINEYTDGAYPFVSEARWISDFTVAKVLAFDAATTLRNRADLVRAHVYGAIIYIAIGDMFDDFILSSDRTAAAAAVGPANMQVAYDSAITMLDRALPVAQALADVELQRQVLGLRARAKHARAAWGLIRPARTVPGNPLVNDAGAVADANAMLALGGGTAVTWRYRLTPTANNLAGINVGFEMNNRGELRAGNTFVNPDPTRPIVPAPGLAGIAMIDPVTGVASATVAAAIDACCRPAVGNNVPMTQTSAREMHLILAEGRLAAADNAGFLTEINLSRSVDGLPDYGAVVGNGRGQIEYERKTQLFLQGRRLMDMYRFDVADARWLPGATTSTNICFLPVTFIERQANPGAPQPTTARICQ